MRERIIPKDFDLPTSNLVGEHYIPAKARDQAEIERRRRLPHGMIVAEEQLRGLRVATRLLNRVEDEYSLKFSARLLAASGMNTAWYEFAQHQERQVMRRRLKLPQLIAGSPDWRPNSAELKANAVAGFDEAAYNAGRLVKAIEHRSPRKPDYQRVLGRTLGKAALTTACIEIGDLVQGNYAMDDADVQQLVRQRGLQALSDARSLGEVIGSNPSIAQLAEPDSHLSVYWRREAPNGALAAFVTALEQV